MADSKDVKEPAEDEQGKITQFHEMGLDDRILEAVANLGWSEPTLIQEKAIPLALDGKDLLARARTGSGKTAAFAIPVIQRLLSLKKHVREQAIRAIILAPSKELCHQIHEHFTQLSANCAREVRCIDVSGKSDVVAQRPLLGDLPDVVIGTPSRVLAHLNAKNMKVKKSLEILVIDEADLAFSFGFEDDLKAVLGYLPAIYQAILTSATLNEDVKTLKQLVLNNPVVLKLEEPQLPTDSQLTQYVIRVEDEEKFVLIYALFKLKLILGKSIIFVNTVDKCYRLKLYLEQFGIPSCVLNSELPVNTRWHIVSQFNKGIYDIIVASDEKSFDEIAAMETTIGGKKKRRRKDKESGVARGIDFQFVSNVINFDFPPDVDSYIHRVGRTARGNNRGTALSFVSVKETFLMEETENYLKEVGYKGQEAIFKPYNFRMEELEGFRYRAKDANRAVTRIAVREARIKEIKKEIFNSEKLKSYFEDNPHDLRLLRHDKILHTVRLQPHLKDVPDYIIPPPLRNLAKGRRKRSHLETTEEEVVDQEVEEEVADQIGSLMAGSSGRNSKKKGKRKVFSKEQVKYKRKMIDPLRSMEFKFKGRK